MGPPAGKVTHQGEKLRGRKGGVEVGPELCHEAPVRKGDGQKHPQSMGVDILGEVWKRRGGECIISILHASNTHILPRNGAALVTFLRELVNT